MTSIVQDMLTSHRLVGGIVYDAVMRGPWSIISRFEPEHCRPIFPVPERIVAYHYVRRGKLTCALPGTQPIVAGPGTMVLFPRNDAHVICSDITVPPTPAEDVFTSDGKHGPNQVRVGEKGDECAIFCGWLGVSDSDEMLLGALPAMLVASLENGGKGEFLATTLRYAAKDLGADPALVARLSQLFFEEAVLRYLSSLPEEDGRRMTALRDPAIGRALRLLHREGEDDLSLDALARAAGVSRTVLAERFITAFGDPPMRYRTRWRMRRAAKLLREGRESIPEIAHRMGYGSEAAFARAFKKAHAQPPAAWRKRHAPE
ncbi:hypothetical protein AEB_P1197 [Altererythrobacter sp. B11]|uniref:AraC family transcriptional regulator n=1 Tax=Altererythrobacter sp. B11 TaxID=2060312 RepID=UPI000DC7140D|nr:AraC family transcriptional regulator [Altererythrobacter sp. B11]BBC72065.1 hypothetical protein AEB_P1197 [Altererythrobacter sp. B11]